MHLIKYIGGRLSKSNFMRFDFCLVYLFQEDGLSVMGT